MIDSGQHASKFPLTMWMVCRVRVRLELALHASYLRAKVPSYQNDHFQARVMFFHSNDRGSESTVTFWYWQISLQRPSLRFKELCSKRCDPPTSLILTSYPTTKMVHVQLPKKTRQTSDGSFSAVSTATIASKDAFFCIFRDLQDLYSFAPLQIQKF